MLFVVTLNNRDYSLPSHDVSSVTHFTSSRHEAQFTLLSIPVTGKSKWQRAFSRILLLCTPLR